MHYLLKRTLSAVCTLFLVSIILFALMKVMPGHPYSGIIGPNTSPEVFEDLLKEVGYYDPLPIQYINWLKHFFQGDLGYSFTTGQSVSTMIAERIPNTLLLTTSALLLSLIIGGGIGILSAIKQRSWFDHMMNMVSIVLVSFPTFIIAFILIKLFAYDLALLPASGLYDIKANYTGVERVGDIVIHAILPIVCLALTQLTYFQKYLRSAFIDVMSTDYVKHSIAKGSPYYRALFYNARKNMLIPLLTLFFLQLPVLISGALVTETIFIWPGIGKLTYDAVMNRDYMVVMGVLMLVSFVILLSNFLADLSYSLIDKRVRWEG